MVCLSAHVTKTTTNADTTTAQRSTAVPGGTTLLPQAGVMPVLVVILIVGISTLGATAPTVAPVRTSMATTTAVTGRISTGSTNLAVVIATSTQLK